MKKSGILLMFLLAAPAFSQAKKIDKEVNGMNMERDQFYGLLASDKTRFLNWMTDLKVGHVRTQVPWTGATADWYTQCWQMAADLNGQVKVTLHFGTTYWPDGFDKATYLTNLGNKIFAHRGKIAYYQMGNEMDLVFRDNSAVTVAKYKTWLDDVSAVIRTKDPAAKIILTSIAGEPYNGKNYGYLEAILATGAAAKVDYYSIHTYPHLPNSNPSGDALKAFVTDVSNMVNAAGAPRKPLLITEVGYPLTGSFAVPGATQQGQRITNTQRTARFWARDVQTIYPVERVDTFIIRDYNVGPGLKGFGLLDSSFNKRLQYDGIKTLHSKLDGSHFFNERAVSGGSGKCYEYLKPSGTSAKKVVVGWSSDSGTRSASIPLGSTSASITNIDGSAGPAFGDVRVATMSFTNEQKYFETGNLSYWKEGENFSSASSGYTPAIANNAECYNGKHVSLNVATSGNKDLNYAFNITTAGTYAVYIAATPPNASWASTYQYGFNTPLAQSQTSATLTGVSYGTSNGIAWTKLGNFSLSAGTRTLTIRVSGPNTGTGGKYVHFVDAVYLERQ